MNILPHKSWHVRTKKNIARVREDERKAAEESKEVKRRAQLAEQEAKIQLLRERTKFERPAETDVASNTSTQFSIDSCNEHVNFFKELEDGKYKQTSENAERVEEKKQEKEKYEKQIGYLTYLGQDTNEILGKKDWYDILPERTTKNSNEDDSKKIEVNLKSKLLNDPLTIMHKYMKTSSSSHQLIKSTVEKGQPPDDLKVKKLTNYESLLTESLKNYRLKKRKRSCSSSSSTSVDSKKRKKKSKKKKSKKKHSKKRRHSSSSDEELERLKKQKLEALRAERLSREKLEKEKADNLLRKIRGETEPKQKPPAVTYKQKYNTQFNPEIARQNQD